MMTTCRVLYLSDSPGRTQIWWECSPTVTNAIGCTAAHDRWVGLMWSFLYSRISIAHRVLMSLKKTCCSVLQCVAVCCRIVFSCDWKKCVAVCCSVLQDRVLMSLEKVPRGKRVPLDWHTHYIYTQLYTLTVLSALWLDPKTISPFSNSASASYDRWIRW